jgi:hypothetical protein
LDVATYTKSEPHWTRNGENLFAESSSYVWAWSVLKSFHSLEIHCCCVIIGLGAPRFSVRHKPLYSAHLLDPINISAEIDQTAITVEAMGALRMER